MVSRNDIQKNSQAIKGCEVFIGISFLIIGCTIYLLFRSKSLNIYHWCDMLGFADIIDRIRLNVQKWAIPSFIKYSLPDGLYSAAYLLLIDAIWYGDNRSIRYLIISLIPLVTIGSEILQYWGMVKGTFDINDLVCYSIPPLIYILSNYKPLNFNKIKSL